MASFISMVNVLISRLQVQNFGKSVFLCSSADLVCKSLAIEIYETQYLCHLRSKNKLMKLPPRNLTHALSFDFVEFSLAK
jgi:hypothetical protein